MHFIRQSQNTSSGKQEGEGLGEGLGDMVELGVKKSTDDDATPEELRERVGSNADRVVVGAIKVVRGVVGTTKDETSEETKVGSIDADESSEERGDSTRDETTEDTSVGSTDDVEISKELWDKVGSIANEDS